ncbi:N-6 DNA methylase [Paraburkholderia sp. BL6665CI2N2]|uniref:HsdM family class I SAM-dependent methyltransferase n=1 Tax=Paraburkholderia sp. BL6665CI2N2 TaxID=1938806 RepID=UPI001065FA69|nr:N-6 DNA methylase [Paraburkholderia sp. BL6665CI2N2]TDY24587.1 N-6 DNA methylase [Paraburkholderia sp. BL6665CI2N2]
MPLPRKTRFNRLVRGLRLEMHELGANPDAVVGAALARWCKESFPGLPKSSLPARSAMMRTAAIIAFVDFVKEDEFLEATYWLASAYAQLAGDERRKNLAMFFTPPSLTKRLLDELSSSGVDFAARSFCDPACGGAAFLSPIAIRMRDALRAKAFSPPEILEHVQSHLLGIDKEGTLCKLSRQFLAMALYEEVLATGTLPEFQVVEGDSLLEVSQLFGKLDVVVCNPPFRKMRAFEVQTCFEAFEDIIEAQPNLYALFIALCVRLLTVGGTCALVTPTSFLSGQNFSKLRTFLLARTKVLGIGMVSDRQGVFIDVEQETALTLLRREDNGHAPSMKTEVSVVSRDGTYVDVGRCTLPNSGAAWPIPRSLGDISLLKSAAKLSAGLADYGYTVRIGSFVWNRDTRPTYPSAKSAARAKGGTAVPLLWSSDIAANRTLRFAGVPKSNKEPCFVNLGSKSHPSVVKRPSVLLQRVTSNDQPRRLVAAVVSKDLLAMYGGFVGENHTVILEQVSHEPVLTPEQLAILLGTPTVDRYFRCISGATNVSVFELSQLRLPKPERLKAFLAQGYDLAEAARMTLDD